MAIREDKPWTVPALADAKRDGRKLAMLTAYDYPSALLAKRAGVRLILVGDSMGMVVHGHDTTLPVTMDDIVRHAAAVTRGTKDALVVGDLPFMSYAIEDDGVRNAAISGETDWHRQAYALGAGTHTLGWRYYKSANTIVGADRRFSYKLVLAVGSGLAHERQQTGDNGHATEATATRRASLLGRGLPITELR